MLAAILTLLGVIAAVIGLVIPQLGDSVEQLISSLINWIPDAIDWVADMVADSESLAEIVPQEYLDKLEAIDWEEWFTKIIQFLSNGIGGAVGTTVGAVTSVFSGVVTFFLGFIFALYLLIAKDRLLNQGNRLMKSYLPEVWRERISHVLTVLNDCFHRYVVGQCTEAVILGSLCIIGMLIFRFPYATMIGTLVGFTALIPVAGAYIGAIVGAFMILTVSPLQALLFVVFLTVLQQLEGNLIYPKVVGSSLGLPGMWVLAAVTVGGGLFGIGGMLVFVPLVATIYRLLRDDVRRREGKERAEYNRRHRERREKKRVKDAKTTPKLNGKAVIEPAKKKQMKENQQIAGKVEKSAAEQTAVKTEKKANAQKKSQAEIVTKQEHKTDTNPAPVQDNLNGNGQSSGQHRSRKRRRKKKKSVTVVE